MLGSWDADVDMLQAADARDPREMPEVVCMASQCFEAWCSDMLQLLQPKLKNAPFHIWITW